MNIVELGKITGITSVYGLTYPASLSTPIHLFESLMGTIRSSDDLEVALI